MSCAAPRQGRRIVRSVLTFALAFLLPAGCSSTDVDQTTPGSVYEFTGATAAGQVIESSGRAAAPPFTGELLDGTAFDSASLTGDVAVINFWGSWCAPCRVETPDLQAVYADVRDRGCSSWAST